MTRRSLRHRRERFPSAYTAPASAPRAPAGQALPPGFRLVEMTPAMQDAMHEELVELTRKALGTEYGRRLFVVKYQGKPVFAQIEQSGALGNIREFMRAAVATGAAIDDFVLVVREIPAFVEGDKVYPAVSE